MSRDQLQSLKEELSSLLLDLDIVKKKDYDEEVKHVNNSGGNIFDALLKDDKFTLDQLLESLSKKYGVGFKKIPTPMLPEIKKFPILFCLKNGLIPINESDTTVEFGICTPTSLNVLKNLGLMIGRKTKAVFIPPEYIFQSIQQQHIHTEVNVQRSDLIQDEDAPIKVSVSSKKKIIDLQTDNIKNLKKEKTSELDLEALGHSVKNDIPVEALRKAVENKEKGMPKLDIKLPGKKAPNLTISVKKKEKKKVPQEMTGDVVSIVDDILSEAVKTGVSDIHIEIFKETAQIRFRGGGTLLSQFQYKTFISDNYNAVIARIKILANLDIAERRLPQDGKIAYRSKDGTEVDFRISILPTNLGERVVIRILDSSSLAVTLDAIGFTKDQEADFISAIESPQGLILVTGPTGSGKSTTLYGAMNHLNHPDVNILTAEDPVEYTMSGISQVQIREDIGLTFANALRSFLRQDPEIILVGEIRDAETADIASKAALTGHLVLSTLHTNGAIGAISRLINMGLPAYLVSSALSLVVAQRLVRKNCGNCKVPINKDNPEITEFIKTYKLKSSAKLVKGEGCSECKDTGYSGRKGVHEVLVITADLEEAISANKPESELLAIAEKSGFTRLSDAAIRFVEDGTLSVEEYLRVIPQDD